MPLCDHHCAGVRVPLEPLGDGELERVEFARALGGEQLPGRRSIFHLMLICIDNPLNRCGLTYIVLVLR